MNWLSRAVGGEGRTSPSIPIPTAHHSPAQQSKTIITSGFHILGYVGIVVSQPQGPNSEPRKPPQVRGNPQPPEPPRITPADQQLLPKAVCSWVAFVFNIFSPSPL